MLVLHSEYTVWCWFCNRIIEYDVGFAIRIYSMMLVLQSEYTVWCWFCNRNIQYDVGFATGIYSMMLILQPEYTASWFCNLRKEKGLQHHSWERPSKKKEDKAAELMHENGRVGVRPKATENNSSWESQFQYSNSHTGLPQDKLSVPNFKRYRR